MCSNFIRNGKIIKPNKYGKKIYEIPIIIESSEGAQKYKFKIGKELNGLKFGTIYEAHYKLIKFCSNNVWDKIKNS